MRLRASMSATEGWLAQRMIQHRRCHLRPCAGLTAALMVWDFPDRGGLPHGDRAMAGIYLWILRHHGLIRNPIMTSFHTARRSDRGQLLVGHRGREQACARPPAQIPACALTHGAPASGDDEMPLVRPRALKPVAVTRETPTQGRHRKCVLHCLGSAEWSFPTVRFGYCYLGRRHSERKTPFRVSLRCFSYPVSRL